MAGRPKKPVALKKMQGTYRADRDSLTVAADEKIKNQLPARPLKIPNWIKNKTVRTAYKRHIELLRLIGAEQTADSPFLENAYFALEKAAEIREMLFDKNPLDEDFEILMKRFSRFYEIYSSTVKDFYLTPSARVKLTLDTLTSQEKEIGIASSKQNIIDKLIREKES